MQMRFKARFFLFILFLLISINIQAQSCDCGANLPLTQPNVSDTVVARFAAAVAVGINNYDFTNKENRAKELQPYFTPTGWTYLGNLPIRKNQLLAVAEKQLTVSSMPLEKVQFLKKGLFGDRYSWEVTLPLLLNYQSPTGEQKQTLFAHLLIVRSQDVESGLQVEMILLDKDKDLSTYQLSWFGRLKRAIFGSDLPPLPNEWVITPTVEVDQSQLSPCACEGLKLMDQAVLTNDQVVIWLDELVRILFTINYQDPSQNYPLAQKYFTEAAWQQFYNDSTQSGFWQTLQTYQLDTEVAPLSPPIITQQGLVESNYQWKVSYKINIHYKGSSGDSEVPFRLTVTIKRTMDPQGIRGLIIDSLLMESL